MARTIAKPKARSKNEAKRSGSATLLLIALFKLFKGFLLLAVAIGALRLLHRDVAESIEHWVRLLRVDPRNHYIHLLLSKLFAVTPNQLKELSAGTFVYSALLLTEGVGLLLRKRWAEYFTVIMTAIPLPFEVYVLVHHARHSPMSHLVPADQHLPVLFSSHVFVLKIAVLIINAGIVWYLFYNLRRGERH